MAGLLIRIMAVGISIDIDVSFVYFSKGYSVFLIDSAFTILPSSRVQSRPSDGFFLA